MGANFIKYIFLIHQEKVVWGNITILSNINYTFPLFSESWFWLDKQQCPNNFNDLYYKRRLDNLFTTFCLTKVLLIRSLCKRVNKITPTMFVIIHQPNLAISAISAELVLKSVLFKHFKPLFRKRGNFCDNFQFVVILF